MRAGRWRRSRALPSITLVVLVLLAACSSPAPVTTLAAGARGGDFPRSATTYLSQDTLPPPADFAMYDVVVIDNEWAHRVGRNWFDQLRHLHPGVVVLAYVNLVDEPDQLGSPEYYANRYALWRFTDATTSRFPAEWQARTAAGKRVRQYPGTSLVNLTDRAPAVAGRTYAQYATDWVVGKVWSTGLWDGVFLDVWGDRIYGADATSWDVAGTGTDVADERIYGADAPWGRGVTAVETLLRRRLPAAVLVANGDRTLTGGRLDGRASESFADAAADREPSADLARYVTDAAGDGHRRPGYALTINARRAAAGSAQDYRNARFFLTSTLLQNGYWAPMGQDYEHLAHYDELDGAGLGRGYLGRPLVADPTTAQLEAGYRGGVGTVAGGVFRRDFTGGVVLNNPTGVDRAVALGDTFRRLRGTQDPLTNDGGAVSTVRVPAHDGLVLVRAG